MITFTVALGGLLFGYDWVVIGGAKPFYEKFFNLTSPAEIGWAMSCALVGCMAGSLLSGGLSDRFGRKRLLILAAMLFAASAAWTSLSGTFAGFVTARILGGVAIGLASNLSPMYIAEVSPAAIRGTFVSVNQLTIVIGILLAQIVNLFIAEPVVVDATAEQILASWNGQYGWRWMFGAELVPAFLFFVMMLFVPESPRWLIKNGDDKRGFEVLKRIGGQEYARQETDHIKTTLINEIHTVHYSELLKPKMLKIIGLGVFLALFQQWCGINTIFNYAEEIFTAAGYGVSDMLFNIVITGIVNLVFTFVAIYTVDKFGRKALMLIGSAGLVVTYLLLGWTYHTHSQGVHVLILVVLAIACYACSLAPIVWVIISEIFPNRIRGAAVSVAVCALWSGCFLLTYLFPTINTSLGPDFTFWMYAAICVVGFVVIKLFLPETKGKTLEEIEEELIGLD